MHLALISFPKQSERECLDFETLFRNLETPRLAWTAWYTGGAAESWESVPLILLKIFCHGLELASNEKKQSFLTRG